MNAKEFSIILRKFSEVLDSFGDEPLENVLDKLDKLLKKRKEKVKPNQKEVQISNGSSVDLQLLIKEIRTVPLEKVAGYLKNNPNTKSKPQLLALAKGLSIAAGSRSTKDSLIHAITKYFERDKLDDIISNKSK